MKLNMSAETIERNSNDHISETQNNMSRCPTHTHTHTYNTFLDLTLPIPFSSLASRFLSSLKFKVLRASPRMCLEIIHIVYWDLPSTIGRMYFNIGNEMCFTCSNSESPGFVFVVLWLLAGKTEMLYMGQYC